MPQALRAADTVMLIDDVELSGTGVTSGSMWKNGVDLAIKEINAAGGILGRQITVSHQDNQSQAQIAKAVATKAVDDEPYVLLGPIFSGDVNVSSAVAEDAEIPMIMGGEAANLTAAGQEIPVPHVVQPDRRRCRSSPTTCRRSASSRWRWSGSPTTSARAAATPCSRS